jgi:hypothetical protein
MKTSHITPVLLIAAPEANRAPAGRALDDRSPRAVGWATEGTM